MRDGPAAVAVVFMVAEVGLLEEAPDGDLLALERGRKLHQRRRGVAAVPGRHLVKHAIAAEGLCADMPAGANRAPRQTVKSADADAEQAAQVGGRDAPAAALVGGIELGEKGLGALRGKGG